MEPLGILVGLVVGMIGSLLFAYLVQYIRPSIEISDVAAFSQKGGVPIIKIKVANNSSQPAIDIKAELHRIRRDDAGLRDKTHRIALVRDDPLILGRKEAQGDTDLYVFVSRKSTDAGSLEDTMEKYPGSRLRFRLMATHPVSGAKRVFERTYDWDSEAKPGDYASGRPINTLL